MHLVEDFRLGERAMRYSLFAPRLYNYCLSLGFARERMMPSRAFCSDETQGYPIVLLMQQFGTFPFDHGRIGGKVATNRHAPHAHHGEDLILIQASHVGYDPVRQRFGVYERLRTNDHGYGDTCGKLCAVLHWYQDEYRYACESILCGDVDGTPAVIIDNHLLNTERPDGLFLRLERMIDGAGGASLKVLSTAKAYPASAQMRAALPAEVWTQPPAPIGKRLSADLFFFRRQPIEAPEGDDLLESALLPVMANLVTSERPALDAARYHTQNEFDRTYRSIRSEPAYKGKNLLFISGLNVDVSPPPGLPFPLTKFIPWAAYIQMRDGTSRILEQEALVAALLSQPTTNPDQISFDAAIRAMAEAETITLPV